MTTKKIFEGITTAELLSYRVAGDNSKELKEEIERRAEIEIQTRVNNEHNLKGDAQFNGERIID